MSYSPKSRYFHFFSSVSKSSINGIITSKLVSWGNCWFLINSVLSSDFIDPLSYPNYSDLRANKVDLLPLQMVLLSL
jgi:hypothetical protein